MKADKGAAASGFCPSPPRGFPSQSLQFTLKKKKKKEKGGKALKESYRQLPKQNKKPHKIQTVFPSALPPPPNTTQFLICFR